MTSIDDLKGTLAWKKADATKRAAMQEQWDAHPEERAAYLVIAQGKAPPLAQPTPNPPPTPIPGAVAPGRQMDLPVEAPYLASGLGLAGSLAATAAFPARTAGSLAMRVGIPALLGAIGGAVDPRDDAASGAGRETAAVIGGEGAAKVAQGATRLVKGALAKAGDATGVTKAIGEAVPWLKSKIEASPASLTKLFRSGLHPESAERVAGESLEIAKNAVESMVGPQTQFRFKSLRGQLPERPPAANSTIQAWQARPKPGMTFQEVDGLLEDLRQQSSIASQEQQTHRAIELRKIANRIRTDFVNALNKESPGAGSLYRQARQHYADTKSLGLLMGKKGVIDEAGNINMAALQKVVQEDPKLAKRFGTPAMQKVIKAIGRGSAPVGMDTAGKLPMHWHPGNYMPRFQVPSLPRKVGIPVPQKRFGGVVGPLLETGTELYNYLLPDEDTLKPGQAVRR